MAAPPNPHIQPPQFFVDNKKGQVNQLRQLLKQIMNERDQNKRRDVVKKVIAYMTLGIDVSRLFTDMVLISSTPDIVQKKMIYLYLISYAEANQDQALLVINTFFKDCQRSNNDPKIRGLALRSLCSMRFNGAVEYIQSAIQDGLTDPDPYVRRTAVMGVIKLFRFNRQSIEQSNFINTLYEIIRDSDPIVSTNAILALNEILEDEGGIAINRRIVVYLLNRIHQYNEFCQSTIFDIVSKFWSQDEAVMLDIMSALQDRLRHASASVVLGCVKIFLNYTRNNPTLLQQVFSRIHSILVTHFLSGGISGSPELSYAVLAHIHFIIKCGGAQSFESDYKSFFCKYDDPTYIKFMKIDILTLVSSENSFPEILTELCAYVTDVNVEISKKSIRSIGQIALRVPSSSSNIIYQLLSFLNLKIEYVITETLSTMKDLMRKYKDLSLQFIPQIESSLEIVNQDQGKAAIVWMIGQFGQEIDDSPYILESLVQNSNLRDSLLVSHSLLTACIKLFLKRAPEMQITLSQLFNKIFTETEDPDLHDRAGFYYKLLRTDPEMAHQIVNAEKHPVSTFYEDDSKSLFDIFFKQFNQLSIIYQEPQRKFQRTNQNLISNQGPSMSIAQNPINQPPADTDLLLLDDNDMNYQQEFVLMMNPEMSSEDFQNNWMNLQQEFNFTRLLTVHVTIQQVQDLMIQKGIVCIASGEQDNFLKFYFYGKGVDQQVYMMELNVNLAQGEIGIIGKGGSQLSDFIRVATEALSGIMQVSQTKNGIKNIFS